MSSLLMAGAVSQDASTNGFLFAFIVSAIVFGGLIFINWYLDLDKVPNNQLIPVAYIIRTVFHIKSQTKPLSGTIDSRTSMLCWMIENADGIL